MARRLEKSTWWIQLAAVVLLGLLVALGVNSFLAARVVDALPASGPDPEVVAVQTRAIAEEQAEMAEERPPSFIVESRNLFNRDDTGEPEAPDCEAEPDHPDCAAVSDAGEPAGGVEGPAEPGQAPAATSEKLPLELIGTMVASDPRYSSAHLKQTEPMMTDHFLHIGDTFEGFSLIQIKRNYVVFHDAPGGRLAVVSRGQEQQVSSSVVQAPDGARLEVPEPTEDEPLEATAGVVTTRPGHIQRDSKTASWQIDAELIAAQAEQAAAFGEALQIEAGEDGARIGEVPSGSMLEALGLRAGDVIVSLSGAPSGEDAAEVLLEGLSGEGEVVMKLMRDGKPLVYQLRRSR